MPGPFDSVAGALGNMAGTRHGAAASLPAAPQPHPDADLVRLCQEHVVNMRAYGASSVTFHDCAQDPLWRAYTRTRDAICAARPQSINGILAIAQAAKAEAQLSDGGEDYGGQPGEFAWQVVNHLVRLGGNAGIPD